MIGNFFLSLYKVLFKDLDAADNIHVTEWSELWSDGTIADNEMAAFRYFDKFWTQKLQVES